MVVDWRGLGSELRLEEGEVVAVRLDGCVDVVLLLLVLEVSMVAVLDGRVVLNCELLLGCVCLQAEVCLWSGAAPGVGVAEACASGNSCWDMTWVVNVLGIIVVVIGCLACQAFVSGWVSVQSVRRPST